jgi:cytochrome c-type biogenesis protein CcmE
MPRLGPREYTEGEEDGRVMKNYIKFGALIVVILGTLAWLAVGGISETKTYYKTVAEIHQLGDQAHERRLRVGGDIAPNSIVRNGADVSFTLAQDQLRLKVVYNGIDPLPDTFRDGAQALADGKLGADGVFRASKIQAKCASKYEAKPTNMNGGTPAVRS